MIKKYEEILEAAKATFFSLDYQKILKEKLQYPRIITDLIRSSNELESKISIICPICGQKITSHQKEISCSCGYKTVGLANLRYKTYFREAGPVKEAIIPDIYVNDSTGVFTGGSTIFYAICKIPDGEVILPVAVSGEYDVDKKQMSYKFEILRDEEIWYCDSDDAYRFSKKQKRIVIPSYYKKSEFYFSVDSDDIGYLDKIRNMYHDIAINAKVNNPKKENKEKDSICEALSNVKLPIGRKVDKAMKNFIVLSSKKNLITEENMYTLLCPNCFHLFENNFTEGTCTNCGYVSNLSSIWLYKYKAEISIDEVIYLSSYKDYLIISKIIEKTTLEKHPDGSYYFNTVLETSSVDTVFIIDINKCKLYSVNNYGTTGETYTKSTVHHWSGRYARRGVDSVLIDTEDERITRFLGLTELINYIKKNNMSISLNILSEFICKSFKYPIYEKLVKGGYEQIVYGIISNEINNTPVKEFFNEEASTIGDFFCVPNYIIKAAKQAEVFNQYNLNEILSGIIKGIYTVNVATGTNNMNSELLKYMVEYDIFHQAYINRCLLIAQKYNISLEAQIAYINRVRINQCIEPVSAIGFWADYLNAAEKIGVSMTDKKVLFPTSLKREHDIITYKASLISNKVISDEFEKRVVQYGDKYAYTLADSAYIISYPKTIAELLEEGRKLNHCVGNYADSITKGNDIIMFLRYKETPDEPFYTIGILPNGTITEIATFSNQPLVKKNEPKLVAFLEHWANIKGLSGFTHCVH